MDISSKTILLTLFIACLNISVIDGGENRTPAVDACVSTPVGSVCTLPDTVTMGKTCGQIPGGNPTATLTCCNTVDAGVAKSAECKCCPPGKTNCDDCKDLTRSTNNHFSAGY